MLKQGPDFHFEISEISEFEITRLDCTLSSYGPMNNTSAVVCEAHMGISDYASGIA